MMLCWSTGSLLSDLEPGPIRLDGLRMLMTRESPRDPPQYSIITFGADPMAAPAERRLSDFPHPYPSIRDLQKEIVRRAFCPDSACGYGRHPIGSSSAQCLQPLHVRSHGLWSNFGPHVDLPAFQEPICARPKPHTL